MHGTSRSAKEDQYIGDDRPAVVWFEVEDFLRYFDHFRNPTGMQRLPFEIFVEAERLYGGSGRVRFCRLSIYTKQFMPIEFDAILAAYLDPPGAGAPWTTVWGPPESWKKLLHALPIVVRHPRFFFSIFKTAVRDFIDMVLQRRRFERLVRPGDIIVSLGASWGFPGYMQYIARAQRRYGVRFAMLVHDTIPIENESFVEPLHLYKFRTWLEQAIANADTVLTVSKYSRDTLSALALGAGWQLPRIEVLQPGAGFCNRPIAGQRNILSLPKRYVLCVSTIEIRKNHRLLVRVWQRLIKRHGSDVVPMLIFAGQVGWMVADFVADLEASRYLGGKIAILAKLSDAEINQAYRSCLFTVFPSLCEGWGLPVAESLAHGKFCVASNRTSIPEVGGDFVDYFDPSDDDEALAKIERVLFEPGYLAAREARLQAEYHPRAWADCAHGLIEKLDFPAPAIKQ